MLYNELSRRITDAAATHGASEKALGNSHVSLLMTSFVHTHTHTRARCKRPFFNGKTLRHRYLRKDVALKASPTPAPNVSLKNERMTNSMKFGRRFVGHAG